MKYMIMTFGGQSSLAHRSPEWVRTMIGFMQKIDVTLAESGELVFQQGLADAPHARTVRVEGGSRLVAEGSHGDPATSLAGFWIVDVSSESRAITIAAQISQAAEAPVEVRQCVDAPPSEVLERPPN